MNYRPLRKWGQSLLVGILLMLLVFLGICLFMLQSLRSSTLQTVRDMAVYIGHSTDSRISELQKNVNSLALDPVTMELKNARIDNVPAASRIYSFCDRLNTLRITSNMMSEILIYYPNLDIVTGSLGYYTENQYKKLMDIRHQGMASNTPCWKLPHTNASFTIKEDRLFYFYDLIVDSVTVANIVMELNTRELLSTILFDKDNAAHNLSALGISIEDHTIYANDETINQNMVEPAVLKLTDNHQNSTSYKGLLFLKQPSLFSKIFYFVVLPEASVFRSLYVASVLDSIGIVLLIILGVLFSLRFSSRHIRPVQEILKMLEEASGTVPMEEDIYYFISRSVRELLEERHHNISMIEAQRSVIDDLSSNQTYSQSEDQKIDQTPMQEAVVFIKDHICDPSLGASQVADHLKVSNSYLSSHFKKEYGIGVLQYINQLRVDMAEELIKTTNYRIKDIAQIVGFSSDISFIRVFKQYKDCTPASLRKQDPASSSQK